MGRRAEPVHCPRPVHEIPPRRPPRGNTPDSRWIGRRPVPGIRESRPPCSARWVSPQSAIAAMRALAVDGGFGGEQIKVSRMWMELIVLIKADRIGPARMRRSSGFADTVIIGVSFTINRALRVSVCTSG